MGPSASYYTEVTEAASRVVANEYESLPPESIAILILIVLFLFAVGLIIATVDTGGSER